ncbi:Crp/Fnr family transcriptional regulator [Tenacibaculum amylolyticum]|uniref:Crp/Fnr family transcriptional regulator n=1 Tax=Tenacibaculum amylolyticum TaxID=104269 RepID=UPI0038934422
MIKIDPTLIDDDVFQTLFVTSTELHFKRNEIIVESGKVCNYLFLVQKGMLRSFYYDKKGNDITNWFSSEDMLITSAHSFFKRHPSFLNIEAIEDTTVRAITHQQLEEAFQKSHSLERFGRLFTIEVMLAVGKKAIYLQTKSAKERYHELLKTYPDIFNRAKLRHIAGYLGIAQQSLSRIRSGSK